MGALSGLAIPIGYEVGKLRLTGSGSLDGHEVTWLLAAEVCTIGISLMTCAALNTYQAVLKNSERSRARFAALFEQAPDGLVELDGEGRIAEANSVAHQLFGAPQGTLAGHAFTEVLTRAGVSTTPDLSQARPGSPLSVELHGVEMRVLELSVNAGLARAPGRRLLVIRDVSERRMIEERLGHAQRLEIVGQLAGSVAHDFNNLLTTIGGNAAMIIEEAGPGSLEAAHDILEAQRRGSALTRQLLAFGRREMRRPEWLDLQAAVAGISRLLDRLLGEQHRLRLRSDLPVVVFCDRGQLEQVTINLVTNARDAMPHGGEVEVIVSSLEREDARQLGSGLTAPKQALIEVIDGGVGMTPETLARIFQPFFTTKPRGNRMSTAPSGRTPPVRCCSSPSPPKSSSAGCARSSTVPAEPERAGGGAGHSPPMSPL